MPKQTYAQKKPHIYKWVETHREQYNEICKIKQRRYYHWKNITVVFRNILIEDI